MNDQRKSFPILFTLAACLSLPLTAAPNCRVEIDAPALVMVEAASGLTLDSAPARSGAVVLEASPTHLVIAASRPAVLFFEAAAGCELRVDLHRAELRRRLTDPGPGAGMPALATSFHPLAFATKEEDHDFDPDPTGTAENPALQRALVTLIRPGAAFVSKEEDHDFDPDPTSQAGGEARGWARDWSAAAAVIGQLGPGWYFVVRGGEVVQEILIEPRRPGA